MILKKVVFNKVSTWSIKTVILAKLSLKRIKILMKISVVFIEDSDFHINISVLATSILATNQVDFSQCAPQKIARRVSKF